MVDKRLSRCVRYKQLVRDLRIQWLAAGCQVCQTSLGEMLRRPNQGVTESYEFKKNWLKHISGSICVLIMIGKESFRQRCEQRCCCIK